MARLRADRERIRARMLKERPLVLTCNDLSEQCGTRISGISTISFYPFLQKALKDAGLVPVVLPLALRRKIQRIERGAPSKKGGPRLSGRGQYFFVAKDVADVVAKINPRLQNGRLYLGPEPDFVLSAARQLQARPSSATVSTHSRTYGWPWFVKNGMLVKKTESGLTVELRVVGRKRKRFLRCAQAVQQVLKKC